MCLLFVCKCVYFLCANVFTFCVQMCLCFFWVHMFSYLFSFIPLTCIVSPRHNSVVFITFLPSPFFSSPSPTPFHPPWLLITRPCEVFPQFPPHQRPTPSCLRPITDFLPSSQPSPTPPSLPSPLVSWKFPNRLLSWSELTVRTLTHCIDYSVLFESL